MRLAGHARAVLAIKNEEQRTPEVLEKMAGMSVRQAEKFAKDLAREPEHTPQKPVPFAVDYTAELSQKLESILGRRVRIEQGKTAGTISLEFYGTEDLERLSTALEKLSI